MRCALELHPESDRAGIDSIEVEVRRVGTRLRLLYILSGSLAGIRLPPPSAPARSDRLWEHSCFEAFLQALGTEGYQEFNFAPSRQWASYRLAAYRAGLQVAEVPPPRIEVQRSESRFELTVELEGLPRSPWRLGLSAIVEQIGGARSYWALAHPPGKPDFHHPDSFVLELPVSHTP